MLGILLISFASAYLGEYKQGTSVDIKGKISNATSVSFNLYYPDSSIAIKNGAMKNLGGEIWNYTFSNTTILGRYVYDYCDQAGTNCKENYFEITYTGKNLSSSQTLLYIPLFMVIIFAFIITLLGINKLPKYNQQDEEGKILSITYLKYLRPVLWFFEWMLFITILYLSSNLAFAYLNEQLFAQILFVLFRICFGITPLIVTVWMIWIYVKLFHDRQLQKLLNRGFFPQGRLP